MVERWCILIRKGDGTTEVLAVLHHTHAEATITARAWLAHFKNTVEMELIRLEIPELGEPVALEEFELKPTEATS